MIHSYNAPQPDSQSKARLRDYERQVAEHLGQKCSDSHGSGCVVADPDITENCAISGLTDKRQVAKNDAK